MADYRDQVFSKQIDLSAVPGADTLAEMESDTSPAAGAYPRRANFPIGMVAAAAGLAVSVIAAVRRAAKAPAQP